MPTINELRAAHDNRELMRKMRQVFIFLAPLSAEPVTELTDETGAFKPIPTDYIPVGLLDKEANITFPRDVESSEESSIGHGGPTRKDTDSDIQRIAYTAQETKRANLEMAYGYDLANLRPKANGEVGYARPQLPDDIQRRLLVFGLDTKYGIGCGMFLPQVEPMDFPEITWGPTGLTSYATTAQAYHDTALGYSVFDIPLCGPRALEFAEKAGFGQPATAG